LGRWIRAAWTLEIEFLGGARGSLAAIRGRGIRCLRFAGAGRAWCHADRWSSCARETIGREARERFTLPALHTLEEEQPKKRLVHM
jgi:hypothetical protein